METSKLDLDPGVVDACRQAATRIAGQVAEEVSDRTTVSVERTVARLLGVDGVNELEVAAAERARGPRARARAAGLRGRVLAGQRDAAGGRSPQQLAEAVSAGELDICGLPRAPEGAIRDALARECERRLADIRGRMGERRALRERLGESPPPLRYVLTATGNVYEDVVHGLAVAEAGGDIVAVIRSTAQSLLDYVPYGPTTEGYGGTFATQANFRIMREALDEWSERNGRYVRLSSFCSGLCMSEIATMGAIEGLDNMVNDALYGILYRDINILRGADRPARLAHDQRVLRRHDQHRRGQLPAHRRRAGGGAVGDGFAVHQPPAGARLGRARRADRARRRIRDRSADATTACCTSGRRRSSRASCSRTARSSTCRRRGTWTATCSARTPATRCSTSSRSPPARGSRRSAVPTEGIFTPHIHDRVLGLQNVNYVFNSARDLGDEIEFRRGGIDPDARPGGAARSARAARADRRRSA